jgi:hypothetical protein
MAAAEAETPKREKEKEKESTLVTPRRGPELPLPGMHVGMPTGLPGRVLWWGGLAALAAFDVVDWPVAVLVGAGSWVAEQYAKEAAERRAVTPHQTS